MMQNFIPQRKGACMEIDKLIVALEKIRKNTDNITIVHTLALLRILTDPGIAQADLTKVLGVSDSTTSRAVQALGMKYGIDPATGRNTQSGWGLVESLQSDTDSRYKELHPTKKGERLKNELRMI